MNKRFNPQKFLKITRIFAFIGATIALAQTALSEPIKFSPTEDLTIGIKNPSISDGGNMLEGSTSSDKWNRFVTIDGRKLSAEKYYTVKFSYLLPPPKTTLSIDSYICASGKKTIPPARRTMSVSAFTHLETGRRQKFRFQRTKRWLNMK